MGNYDNFSNRLSKQIEGRFLEIEAIYNFDYGDETEVAICQLLTSILPDKYGVCRGFIIDKTGKKAKCDDVIIYDKLSYPLIRQNGEKDFSLKQQVPVEAVYAYIECKNAIKTQDVFDKAYKQASDAKEFLFKRESVNNDKYEVDGPIYNGKPRDWPRQEPELINQPFSMIITRKWDKNLEFPDTNGKYTPDLLILGSNHFASQTAYLGADGPKSALFFDAKCGYPLKVDEINENSFGIGIIMLLQALSNINLQPINWIPVLNDELSPLNK